MDPALDCSGGNPALKESVKFLEDIMMENDLVDIWRIRNPDSKKFTWRQKSPIIQRRLDYWLISNTLQKDVVKIDILSAIKTDHLAITLEIDSLDDQPRGPSFRPFGSLITVSWMTLSSSKSCVTIFQLGSKKSISVMT